MKVFNKDMIKETVNASNTATVTMIWLGFRQRAHAFTNLASVKHELSRIGEKPNDKDYMAFWRGMEAAGAGSLILGRRAKDTRFEWNYSLRQIAQLAIEGKDDQLKALQAKASMVSEPLPKKVAKPQVLKDLQQSTVIALTLASGSQAQVILPPGTTSKEIEYLCSRFLS